MYKRPETIFEVLPYMHNGQWFKLEDWQNPTYEGIVVLHDNITKPTLEACNAKLTEMQTQWDSDHAQYKLDRRVAYKSIQEQLDMQYWDAVNGTTTWKDHIDAVKSAHPKGDE